MHRAIGVERQTDKCLLAFCRAFPHPKNSHTVTCCKLSPLVPYLNLDGADKVDGCSSHLVPVSGVVQRQSPILQWKEQLCPCSPPGTWSSAWEGCISCLPPVSTSWGVCRRSAACSLWLLRGLWGCSLCACNDCEVLCDRGFVAVAMCI